LGLKSKMSKRKSTTSSFSKIPKKKKKSLSSPHDNEETNYSLSSGQKTSLGLAVDGKPLFITGGAGTGKSHVFRAIETRLTRMKKKILKLAPTGTAAVNITSRTIASVLFSKNKSFLKKIDILMIDEISMVPDSDFENLSNILQSEKDSSLPFGGLQLIVVGDFFQLPPVGMCSEKDIRYCFQSDTWSKMFTSKNSVVLKTPFRQEGDDEFYGILGRIRTGDMTMVDEEILHDRVSNLEKLVENQDEFYLYSTKKKVAACNQKYIFNLGGSVISFPMVEVPNVLVKKMKIRDNGSSFETYTGDFKMSMRVMINLNINIEKKVCNGSFGKIVGFDKTDNLPIVALDDGPTIKIRPCVFKKGSKYFSCLPLLASKAITIHKSQGKTLNKIVCDCGDLFAVGQGYVALSRVRSLSDLTLLRFSSAGFKVDPDVSSFYQSLE
jgi:ATP-dependent DNA helicase PIF1